MTVYFTEDEHDVVAAACQRLIPADPELGAPGARAAHVADYIDNLLGAFLFDPPHIWAGGPFSGRHGGADGFSRFSALDPLDELAWRTRIEGSRGLAEREINGPVSGWQEQYRDGLEALGDDFARLDETEQDARLDRAPEFKALLYEHTCEGMYGDPVYGGNHDGVGWRFIGFDGDAQPRGYTDVEVSGKDWSPRA
jgi:gluconate 2-dehydrogenase gamma chain